MGDEESVFLALCWLFSRRYLSVSAIVCLSGLGFLVEVLTFRLMSSWSLA